MLKIAKIFKELFFLTLNFYKIAVSVWYMSSMPVILHTGLSDNLRIDETIRNHKKVCEAFSEMEHKHGNSATSFDYGLANNTIIYVAMHK